MARAGAAVLAVLTVLAAQGAALAATPTRAAALQPPQVRAVLFYSPTCPHCHVVLEQQLPPILERFGDQLQVITVNVMTTDGGRLYQEMAATYALPQERLGVPALVVADRVLVGSAEIPQLMPGIVSDALDRGGADWPAFGSLRVTLAAAGLLEAPPAVAPSVTPSPTAPSVPATPRPGGDREAPTPAGSLPAPGTAGADEQPAPPVLPAPAAAPLATDLEAGSGAGAGAAQRGLVDITGGAAPTTVRERFLRDPVGNGLAVLVLAGLLGVLAWAATGRARTAGTPETSAWHVPLLVLAGSGVAAYLSFVEVTGTAAACGPVGDCNTVQQSPYATLFGVVPVGILGLVGYAALGATWLLARSAPPTLRPLAGRALRAGAFAGTLFAAWLTALEPFVIGATCAWCLSSAVILALILVVVTREAAPAPLPARHATSAG